MAGASYTDREGHFQIPHLLPGRYWIGSAQGHPGSSVAVSKEISIGRQAPDDLLLEVPGNTLRGRVIGSTGQGLSRARFAEV